MAELLAALVRAGILSQTEADRIGRIADPDLARRLAEQELAAAIQQGLLGQQGRLIDLLRTNGYAPSNRALNGFWAAEDQLLARAWIPILERLLSERAIAAVIEEGAPDMWSRVNEYVIDWVQEYYINPDSAYLGSIPNLNTHARTVVGNAVSAWHRGELDAPTREEGLPQLISAMQEAFGVERGERIAVTEVTRIHAEAQRTAAMVNPNITSLIFYTSADERVCPQCGPLHGQIVAKSVDGYVHPTLGNVGFPPIHVNCRCRILGLSSAAAEQRIPWDIWRFRGTEARPPVPRGDRYRGVMGWAG